MTIYVRLHPGTTTVEAFDIDLTAEQYAARVINGKAALLRLWSIDAKPAPSASQVVIDAGIVVDATTARQTWALRAKNQAELDADTAAVEKTTLKAALALFDARTATNAQIQRAIAWLIRQQG